MRSFLRFFFYLLYHPFAFAYDLVAATVSVGRWKDWVTSVVPFIQGRRVLEIGHGPGHLQRVLLSRGLFAVGIDESAAMGRLAQRNLRRDSQLLSTGRNDTIPVKIAGTSHNSLTSGYAQVKLTRGVAQQLPFAADTFDSVVATFPSDYITDPETMSEVMRCLTDGGRFVVLPAATLMGRGILDRIMALVFRITHQSPVDPIEVVSDRLRQPFEEAGFHVQIKGVDVKSSLLLIVIATK
jgi:ubiquinone/menaquinone biosynthesis C-methylase UbiE